MSSSKKKSHRADNGGGRKRGIQCRAMSNSLYYGIFSAVIDREKEGKPGNRPTAPLPPSFKAEGMNSAEKTCT